MTFTELGLAPPILRALAAEGYDTPTPIQAQAVPPVMAGRDLCGIAQTGTGKTAAFALPILHRFNAAQVRLAPKTCRALVLAPTRELAAQIGESFRTYGKNLALRHAVVFGGVSIANQIKALTRGVDVLVATPGRLIDLIERRAVTLDAVEVLVLDEADHMLDLGFILAIRRIVRLLPKRRQTLFFSATMPKEIAELAETLLTDPVQAAVTPVAKTADRVEQSVIHVDQGGKLALLVALTGELGIERGLVFTRTKHGADRVAKGLEAAGIAAAAIHGNKSQNQRRRALDDFKAGQLTLLVATDIAARGIDIDGLTHVVNYDLPDVPETYVHRIGRTARAGASGMAVAFCNGEETPNLRAIERLIRTPVPVTQHALGGRSVPANGQARPAGTPDAARPARAAGRGQRPAGTHPRRGGQPRSQGGAPEGRRHGGQWEPLRGKAPQRREGQKGGEARRNTAPAAAKAGDAGGGAPGHGLDRLLSRRGRPAPRA